MKKAVIFLAEGFEEVEAMTPVDLLRRAGVQVEMLSVDGLDTVTGSHGIEITVNNSLNNADISDADLLILPGGMPGTKNLDASREVAEALISADKQGKLIAAICAAPSVLGHLGLLEGKSATCYPGFESELNGAEYLEESVVVDGNIITSRGVGTAIDFGLKLTALLVDDNTSKDLGKGIVYEK